MDLDEETQRLKWLGIAAVIFLISAFLSWRELRYFAFGKTIDANILSRQPYDDIGRYGRKIPKIRVDYGYDDKGTFRRQSEDVDPSWTFSTNQTIAIQYLPGTEVSRLKGHSQFYWVIIFFITLGACGFWIFRIWRSAYN